MQSKRDWIEEIVTLLGGDEAAYSDFHRLRLDTLAQLHADLVSLDAKKEVAVGETTPTRSTGRPTLSVVSSYPQEPRDDQSEDDLWESLTGMLSDTRPEMWQAALGWLRYHNNLSWWKQIQDLFEETYSDLPGWTLAMLHHPSAPLTELTIPDMPWAEVFIEALPGSQVTSLVVSGLERIKQLQGATLLTTLHLSYCPMLKKLDGLEYLPQLTTLMIEGCEELKDIAALEACVMLTELSIRTCPNLKKLKSIGRLEGLVSLEVIECVSIKEIEGSKRLLALEELRLVDCTSLKEIEHLERLSALRLLDVSGCSSLRSLNVQHLGLLEQLDVSGCTQLKKLKGAKQHPTLQELHASQCAAFPPQILI